MESLKTKGSPIAWSDIEVLLAQPRDFSITLPEELEMQMIGMLVEQRSGFQVCTATRKNPSPEGCVDFAVFAKEY
ncbi:MAG: hypothetical protein O7H41_19725 [Planctomycetota bacterium]|nr:hypothetical protein [Planctomycetota bacterium]